MAFDRRNPKYIADPVNPLREPRHFDLPQKQTVAQAGYEVIDKVRPRSNDIFTLLSQDDEPKRNLGRRVTRDGADLAWDNTTIGIER